MRTQRRCRCAFTLVEMLVVIVLALILMTLALMVVPNLSDKRAAARAADQVQGWLLQARSRAMRDQSPSGLRLIVNGLESREMEFVTQQHQARRVPAHGADDGYRSGRGSEALEVTDAAVEQIPNPTDAGRST